MSGWAQTLLLALLDSSVRISVIAGAIGIILAACRAATNGIRYAAWTAVLVVMLLMPVLPYGIPSISIRVPSSVASYPPPINNAVDGTEPAVGAATSRPVESGVASSVAATAPAKPTAFLPTVAAIIYVAGFLVLLFRMIAGWLTARHVQKEISRILPDRVGPVYESQHVVAPITIGTISPRVVLPASWRNWPETKLEAVLAHEFGHVRRRDPLVGFLAHVNCTVFWFHPLAWWLAKKLAAAAEHACDDAAVQVVGQPQQYAEILLGLAQTVRSSGGRFVLQGLGIGGNGFLSERIDRILRNEVQPSVTLLRKTLVALSCAAVILLVVACQQEKRPSIAEEQQALVMYETQSAQRQHFGTVFGQVAEMLKDVPAAERLSSTPKAISGLESHLAENPDDLSACEKLLVFYSHLHQLGFAENPKEIVAAQRRYVYWMIEHHPDYQYSALLFDRISDPEGYAEERRLWLAQTEKPSVTASTLGNAAYFLEKNDRPLAEQMLLRAERLAPTGPWPVRLAELYTLDLLGSRNSVNFSITPIGIIKRPGLFGVNSANTGDTHSALAEDARKKLAETRDDKLLSAVGQDLMNKEFLHLDFNTTELAAFYLRRAVQLNPKSADAQRGLATLRSHERQARIQIIRATLPKDGRYEAVSRLPDKDRFDILWYLADFFYGYGRSWDDMHRDNAMAAWGEAQKYAADLVKLAPRFRNDPEYGTSIMNGNILLGFVAAKKGDRTAALQYLREASKAPDLSWGEFQSRAGMWDRLCSILLDAGHRDAVLDFLEHLAQIDPLERDDLLASAAEIRNGKMPHWYFRNS